MLDPGFWDANSEVDGQSAMAPRHQVWKSLEGAPSSDMDDGRSVIVSIVTYYENVSLFPFL
jgi:hypothetical protein